MRDRGGRLQILRLPPQATGDRTSLFLGKLYVCREATLGSAAVTRRDVSNARGRLVQTAEMSGILGICRRNRACGRAWRPKSLESAMSCAADSVYDAQWTLLGCMGVTGSLCCCCEAFEIVANCSEEATTKHTWGCCVHKGRWSNLVGSLEKIWQYSRSLPTFVSWCLGSHSARCICHSKFFV